MRIRATCLALHPNLATAKASSIHRNWRHAKRTSAVDSGAPKKQVDSGLTVENCWRIWGVRSMRNDSAFWAINFQPQQTAFIIYLRHICNNYGDFPRKKSSNYRKTKVDDRFCHFTALIAMPSKEAASQEDHPFAGRLVRKGELPKPEFWGLT